MDSTARRPPPGGGPAAGRRLPPPPPPGPIARATPQALGRVPMTSTPTMPKPAVAPPPRPTIGLPNLRRNVCPHFYMTGARGAIPIQAQHLLKALMRQDTNVCRCQLRGGVHLEQGYVSDICLSSRFNQCVFYEDELARR
ncbi:MAG: hypothetical protein ACXWOW_08515 [Candidatus Limnocylindrales bacterium]